MALELTNEQFSEIISLIKRHVANHGGNCRVGWALRQIAGEKFEKSIHLKEKIANTIIQSGEYRKEKSAVKEKDWNIFVNPEYKLARFNKLTVIINIILSAIAVTAAVVAIYKQ